MLGFLVSRYNKPIMQELIKDINEILPGSSLVGGSVRDMLMREEPHDYDFSTPLLPDAIEGLVKAAGKRAFITGKRFGTIGFKHDGKFIEVTTYRSEMYDKTRKPTVEYVGSIEQDLARRDFTINAIAYDGVKYTDPFGGRSDIENKTIRAVGVPTHRFKEDPLRMLRAARFAAQLDFTIEEKTFRSMKKNANSIIRVSKERWMQELDTLLISNNPQKGMYVLADTGLLKFILPELALQIAYDQNSDYHEKYLFDHTLEVVRKVPKKRSLRWAALLHDIGKPFTRTGNKSGRSNYIFHDAVGAELVYGIAKRMKWSNELLKEVQPLVLHHLKDDSPLREADNSSKLSSP